MKRRSSGAFFCAGACVMAVVFGPACGGGARGTEGTGVLDPGTGGGDGNFEPDKGPGSGGGFGGGGGPNSNDGGVGTNASCATARGEAKRQAAYLEIVLDGSGSMGDDGKWKAAVAALDSIFDEYYAAADPEVGVGLLIFSDAKDSTKGQGPYPTAADVEPAFVDQAQHKALRARIDGTSYSAGTPTYEALYGGYRVMKPFVPQPPLRAGGRKVVVLVTDGVPRGLYSEQTKCTDEATHQRLASNAGGAIDTFSVGIGPFPTPDETHVYAPRFLSELAIAGGTRASAGCDPATSDAAKLCHFQITPGGGKSVPQLTQEFVAALKSIQVSLGCEYNLEKSANMDPTRVNVAWTDSAGEHLIAQDAVNGWTYDDAQNPTRVLLHGESCQAVSSAREASLRVILGCKTVVN
ncbi:VWA domain-containing protein [Pendulispora brunnea]|uniref:VWA domain-containing protein n=1 Tax=Pendulispora brunnea TaxID=2905690 RepID=A0ABZ2K7H2_9BACT